MVGRFGGLVFWLFCGWLVDWLIIDSKLVGWLVGHDDWLKWLTGWNDWLVGWLVSLKYFKSLTSAAAAPFQRAGVLLICITFQPVSASHTIIAQHAPSTSVCMLHSVRFGSLKSTLYAARLESSMYMRTRDQHILDIECRYCIQDITALWIRGVMRRQQRFGIWVWAESFATLAALPTLPILCRRFHSEEMDHYGGGFFVDGAWSKICVQLFLEGSSFFLITGSERRDLEIVEALDAYCLVRSSYSNNNVGPKPSHIPPSPVIFQGCSAKTIIHPPPLLLWCSTPFTLALTVEP